MPISVHVKNLKPGQLLAYNLQRGAQVILPAGHELTASDIRRVILRWPNMRAFIRHGDLDDLVDFEDDSADRALCGILSEKTEELMQTINRGLDQPESEDESVTQIERNVSGVINYVLNNPSGRILPRDPHDAGSYLAEHTKNVFYLAMLLATKSQAYVVSERNRTTSAAELSTSIVKSLTPLGLGALYMDIGMRALADLETKEERLNTKDWERIRDHPQASLDMLPSGLSPAARMLVKTHHVNFNGTGYPIKLPANKVHIFTRIIRIADSFDAAISPRPYREAKSPMRALWEMTFGPEAYLYDPELMKTFLGMVQPVDIGTPIKLHDGRQVIVVAKGSNPFFPIVVMTHTPDGKPSSNQQLSQRFQLTGHKNDRMASIDDEKLNYLYRRPQLLKTAPVSQAA